MCKAADRSADARGLKIERAMRDLVEFGSLPDSWDLASVVAEATPGNLFPSGIGFNAARADFDRYVPAVIAIAKRGFQARPVEIVRAPKGDRSTRPAADLPVTDQLIYLALITRLKEQLYPGLVTFTGEGTESGYSDFEKYPLRIADAAYVLVADAASFYEYIDHDRMAFELVGATADVESTEALVDLLEIWMQASHGLPQGPLGSAPLADIYISPVVRTLSRAGFEFSRYSDDFRIAATNWTHARRAQLALEGAMRDVGLAVAPGKLRTWKIGKYRDQVERARGDFDAIGRVAIGDAMADYAADASPAIDVTAAERQQAEAIVIDLLDDNRVDIIRTRLMRWALFRLAYSGSRMALPKMSILLRRYPHISHSVSSYCRILLERGDERGVVSAIATWLETDSFRYPWQSGWMLHAACFARKRTRKLARIATETLREGNLPWFVRAQAAICLAAQGTFLSQSDFVGTYELSPEATRPELLASVLVSAPTWADRFIKGAATTPLLRATTVLDPEAYRLWLR